MRRLIFASATVLALAACGSKTSTMSPSAQSGTSPTIVDNQAMPAATGANGTAEASLTGATPAETFLRQAAMSDKFEVESGKMAVEKATAPAVKAFGKAMVDEHTVTSRELKAALASDNVGGSPPPALDASHQALIDKLARAGGADFNRLYRQQQIDSHTQALTIMQGYAATGDKPALKAFAAKTAPKVQMHLDMLNKLPAG